MQEFILTIDDKILLIINGFNSTFLDTAMLYISSKLGWLPLYLLLLYLVIVEYKNIFWLVLVMSAVTILISDQASVHLFKNIFERLRPCHEPDLLNKLHLVKDCGGSFGFVSSHASNSAAIATFFILLLGKRFKWIIPIMVIYTLLIMYSRVYLGVHYPMDVFFGAILGMAVGFGTSFLFRLTNSYL